MTPNPQELHDLQRVLILYNSHIGGHRFAGNVIVRIFLLCDMSLTDAHHIDTNTLW